MEEDDLRTLWHSQAESMTSPEEPDLRSFSGRHSATVEAFLARLLSQDLVWKGLTLPVFFVAAWMGRSGVFGFWPGLTGALATMILALPVASARRVFAHRPEVSVLDHARTLLSDLLRFQLGALHARAATPPLMLFAYFLVYGEMERGFSRLSRPGACLFVFLVAAASYLLSVWTLRLRLRGSIRALEGCLEGLSPETQGLCREDERRARRALLLAVLVVALVLVVGILVFILNP